MEADQFGPGWQLPGDLEHFLRLIHRISAPSVCSDPAVVTPSFGSPLRARPNITCLIRGRRKLYSHDIRARPRFGQKGRVQGFGNSVATRISKFDRLLAASPFWIDDGDRMSGQNELDVSGLDIPAAGCCALLLALRLRRSSGRLRPQQNHWDGSTTTKRWKGHYRPCRTGADGARTTNSARSTSSSRRHGWQRPR